MSPGRATTPRTLTLELASIAEWLAAGAVVVDPDTPGDLVAPLRAQLP